MQHLLVYVTLPQGMDGHGIAKTLVEERLAAGANVIGNASSFYWWTNAVQTTHESICIMQTTSERYPDLEKRLHELHPYVVPCIVAVPIVCGSASFLQWIEHEVAPCKV